MSDFVPTETAWARRVHLEASIVAQRAAETYGDAAGHVYNWAALEVRAA